MDPEFLHRESQLGEPHATEKLDSPFVLGGCPQRIRHQPVHPLVVLELGRWQTVSADAVLWRDDAREIREARALAGRQIGKRAVEGETRLVLVAEAMGPEPEAEPRPPVGVIVEETHAREMLELHPALPIDQRAVHVFQCALISRLRAERFAEQLIRLQILEATGPILCRSANRLAVDEVRDRARVFREGAVLHVADDGAVDVAVGHVLVLPPPRHPHLVGGAREHHRIISLASGLERLFEQWLRPPAHGGGVGRKVETSQIDQIARGSRRIASGKSKRRISEVEQRLVRVALHEARALLRAGHAPREHALAMPRLAVARVRAHGGVEQPERADGVALGRQRVGAREPLFLCVRLRSQRAGCQQKDEHDAPHTG